MALYLASNKIPALSEYNIQQRQAILAIAQTKLSAPQKFILNIIKLFLLIPPFFFIANLQGLAVIAALIMTKNAVRYWAVRKKPSILSSKMA